MSQRSVVIGGYTFRINFTSGRVVAMVPNGSRDSEELAVIARLFNGYSQENQIRWGNKWHQGEWRRCSYPECNNAIYLRPSEMERGLTAYCSTVCSNKVSRLGQEKQYVASHKGITKTELPSGGSPSEGNPSEQIYYRAEDQVENINPRSDLYGKIGRVNEVETKDGKIAAVKVDFGEAGRVIRIYIAGQNLDSITPYQASRKKNRQSTPT